MAEILGYGNRIRSVRIVEVALDVPGSAIPFAPVFPEKGGCCDEGVLFKDKTNGTRFPVGARVHGREFHVSGGNQLDGIE